MAENGSLTPKQALFVQALFECRDIAQAARQAGVSERTAYRYLDDPVVQAAVRETSQRILDGLVRRLRQLGHQAADVLAEAMQGAESWSVRVRAADVTLNRLLQVAELAELEARVAALEEQVLGKERP